MMAWCGYTRVLSTCSPKMYWAALAYLMILVNGYTTKLVSASLAPPYKVLGNTDINENSRWNIGYGKGTSVQDCADQCSKKANCVAISFNAPTSPIHDGNCNFKCFVDKIVEDKGEQAIILRNETNLCKVPPPPPPPIIANCTGPMPLDWKEQCLRADLFYSPERMGLMPDIANGYVGMIVGSDAVYAGGLFNGDATGKFGHASEYRKFLVFCVLLSVHRVERSRLKHSSYLWHIRIYSRNETSKHV